MTAPLARLPKDLQGRLDVILAKPVLRRVPRLQEAISVLVRNAYERQPLTRDQEVLLDDLVARPFPVARAVPGPDQDGAP